MCVAGNVFIVPVLLFTVQSPLCHSDYECAWYAIEIRLAFLSYFYPPFVITILNILFSGMILVACALRLEQDVSVT